ncbi:hypothetical protein [Nitrospira sp. BLG_1]|uniref:hypothetical protein n=1 Tax=Nitrospira sp. BLG_1 TaxID=3395883 RepID=UPI0039BC6C51
MITTNSKHSGYYQSSTHRNLADPAWFGLQDFKVLLLGKPGGTPKAQFTKNKGYRWYS